VVISITAYNRDVVFAITAAFDEAFVDRSTQLQFDIPMRLFHVVSYLTLCV